MTEKTNGIGTLKSYSSIDPDSVYTGSNKSPIPLCGVDRGDYRVVILNLGPMLQQVGHDKAPSILINFVALH